MTPAGDRTLVSTFRALADPTRLAILRVLADHDEMFQKRLVHQVGKDQSVVSRHLGSLKRARLVVTRRDGRFVYLRLGRLTAEAIALLALLGGAADAAAL